MAKNRIRRNGDEKFSLAFHAAAQNTLPEPAEEVFLDQNRAKTLVLRIVIYAQDWSVEPKIKRKVRFFLKNLKNV